MNALIVQMNATVGAIERNCEQIITIITEQQETHVLIIFPELALTGYPPEDLLLRPELWQRTEQALARIQAITTHAHVIIGHPYPGTHGYLNALCILHQGQVVARYFKQHLPNYGVFDEARYFIKGEPTPCVLELQGLKLGLCICEDLWQPGPVEQLINAGVDGIIAINASPFDTQKPALRETLLTQHARRGVFIIYVNCVGGQDELVFDGQSLVFAAGGQLLTRLPAFISNQHTVTLPACMPSLITPVLDEAALIYQALVFGLREYVEKNKFPGVLLGLSGGIDSALTLAIAVDALGADRVQAVMMPSRYTASMSLEDAALQAELLGVSLLNCPIEAIQTSFLDVLVPAWHAAPADTTEENLQARIRGSLLMALSNKGGKLLLTTGNKSEVAVGYCTLYGDMCGGFSVLKDVFKTQVYALAHYRNQQSQVIPERVISRPPSAELSANQLDADSLPPYEELDAILNLYIHARLSPKDISAQGFAVDTVNRIVQLINRSEYKRKQAAPGVKISSCAFGRDWRYPITNEFQVNLLAK
jgi:NAD+ synthase (glutamine-hydrolysing)